MKGILAALLVVAVAFAGCANKPDSSTATTSGGASTSSSATGAQSGTSATSTSTPTSTGTTAPSPGSTPGQSSDGQTHTVSFTSEVRNGTAPLNVTFRLDGTGKDAKTTWAVDFGDGNQTTGAVLPATPSHVYMVPGTLVAKATVKFGDGKSLDSTVSIAVLPASVVGAAALYNKTFTATVPIPNPSGGLSDIATCGWDDGADKMGACYAYQLKEVYDNGGNKTFLVGYKVTVPAGASSLLVEGGTKAAQTCQATPSAPVVGSVGACVPDVDMYLIDPTGAAMSVGTSVAYESAAFELPAPGTWTILLVYFAGAPNVEMSTHIVIT